MRKKLLNLLLLLILSFSGHSQIWPVQGAKLNYTQIMFEHPKVPGAEVYLLQVNEDNGCGTGSKVAQSTDSSTATIISHLKFGKKYNWKYTGVKNGRQLGWIGPMSFEILENSYADASAYRLKVFKSGDYPKATGLLILDEVRTIVDRDGNFVWFLPPDAYTARPEGEINDLQLTPAGTLTFLEGRRAVETDLNGNVLWQAPKDSVAPDPVKGVIASPYSYNHCFKRLANGNYMVQSKINEPGQALPPGILNPSVTSAPASLPVGTPRPQPAGSPMSIPVHPAIMGCSTGMQYDMIKEFDKNGNLVWCWSSKDYFTAEEVKTMLATRPDSGVLAQEPGGHMNAFDVDEKNGFVFAGFRNVSRVVKIDLKTGEAVHSWGSKMPSGGAGEGDGFFAKQHDVTLLKDGSIAVFNNGNLPLANSGMAIEPSGVVIFSQPAEGSKSTVLWKFDCRFNGVDYHSIRGGSVNELKNGNLLVCMGRINRVFEITRDKKVVWQAEMEKYEPGLSSWQQKSLYRVNYTSSLYPCYFAVQTNSDTLNEKEPSFTVRIFNNGTEDDRYTVKISSSKGAYKKQIKPAEVHDGKSVSFDVSPEKLPNVDETITVVVTSNTNPDFERTALLYFVSGRH